MIRLMFSSYSSQEYHITTRATSTTTVTVTRLNQLTENQIGGSHMEEFDDDSGFWKRGWGQRGYTYYNKTSISTAADVSTGAFSTTYENTGEDYVQKYLAESTLATRTQVVADWAASIFNCYNGYNAIGINRLSSYYNPGEQSYAKDITGTTTTVKIHKSEKQSGRIISVELQWYESPPWIQIVVIAIVVVAVVLATIFGGAAGAGIALAFKAKLLIVTVTISTVMFLELSGGTLGTDSISSAFGNLTYKFKSCI